MRLTDLLFRVKVGDLTLKYSNLPERYIKRASEQESVVVEDSCKYVVKSGSEVCEKVYYRTPNAPQYQRRVIERRVFRYTTNRPWTAQFYRQNQPGSMRKKVLLEPIAEWTIFRGDRVEVLVGRDKGKQGIVNQVIQERNWVFVEGLNCHLRTSGKDKDFPGFTMPSEAPLLVTNQVALVDPSDLLPTKVEWRYTESGEKVRVSERSGRIIPMPKMAEETYDYKSKSAYKDSPMDTPEKELIKITFSPKLRTFEMDIMEEMGIKEERVPYKTYWY